MIIIDTGLFFSNFSKRDDKHEIGKSIFNRILDGKYGQPILLDYVYNELLTLTYIRTKNFELCKTLISFIDNYVSESTFYSIHTPIEIFWKSNYTFLHQNFENQKRFLSYTDAIIGEMAEWLNVSYIGTFDSQFQRFKPKIISE
jgi:predicted nucleic acid-binding protein